jgi:glycosyltransferase involved in cell wall biosynthesis
MPKYSLAVVRPFLAPWEIETFDELEKRKVEVFYISTAYPSSSYESILLYVGRLIKQKGVIELILAMKLAKKMISGATLLLVCGGPLEETVKRLSKDLGLEESIRLYGPVLHESMPEVYRVADVLVLPSIATKTWMEQFGYVLAEAMATGILVVASNCGAIPELVKHKETGLLTEPGNPIDLAQRIIEILKNDELKQKVKKNGMKYVRKYHSLEEVVPKLDDFYLTLIQAKR